MKLKRTDISLDKIQGILGMPDLKDFIKCYESLKTVHLKVHMKLTFTKVDNTVYGMLKNLGEELRFSILFEISIEIAKRILTEFVHLSFMTQTALNKDHFQIRDEIACILAVLMAFDLCGKRMSITKIIAAAAQVKKLVEVNLKNSDVQKYYTEVHPNTKQLVPAWFFPMAGWKEMTNPEMLEP